MTPINLEVIYFFADSIFGTSFLGVAGPRWLLRVKICVNQFSFSRSSVQGKGVQGLRQNFVERQKLEASLVFASVL